MFVESWPYPIGIRVGDHEVGEEKGGVTLNILSGPHRKMVELVLSRPGVDASASIALTPDQAEEVAGLVVEAARQAKFYQGGK